MRLLSSLNNIEHEESVYIFFKNTMFAFLKILYFRLLEGGFGPLSCADSEGQREMKKRDTEGVRDRKKKKEKVKKDRKNRKKKR